jgi:hypothetical protein
MFPSPKKHAIGVFLSSDNNYGIQGIFDVPDISGNLGSIEPIAWDWAEYGFFGFSDPDIVYHDNSIVPWIVSCIGSTTNSEGPCVDSVMIFHTWEENPDTGAVVNWFSGYEYCSNVSIAMDDDSKKLYGICEIKNGTNQDLLFFRGDYVSSSGSMDLDFYNKSFAGSESLTHPKIFVKGNHIYVVTVSDIEGVILYKSTNGGLSFTKTPIDIPMSSKYRFM